jgi:hypothetical protein
MRSICDQFAAEHGGDASTMVQQEPRRTNKLTLLGYLDTVEVIGSIPVAPMRQHSSVSLLAGTRASQMSRRFRLRSIWDQF